MWKKILCALLSVSGAGLSVWLFPRVAAEPVTFIDRQMDPDATRAKYQADWDDTTILQAAEPEVTYQSGDIIGTITIPKMNIYELPIYYGESLYNNNWQITCPGHLSGFGLPGEAAPTAIGAHNYQLFAQLPSLKEGDKFIVETDVDVYVYTVVKTEVYNHLTDNWSNLSYNSKDPYDMELMTCYPIDAVVTKDTYIVTAKLQKGTEFTAAQ